MIEQALWRSFRQPDFSPTTIPAHVDVVVVGGGITGLTAAYLLKRAGKRVAVLEREHIGAGETGNTSAHVTYVTDVRLTELVRRFGIDAARSVWRGGETAIDLIESNVETLSIDCGFQRVPNFLYEPLYSDEDESAAMRKEAEAANDLGFSAGFFASGPVRGKAAVAYADQAIFHPLAYISGLARAVHGDGSFVWEQAEFAEAIKDPLGVIVNGTTLTCDHLVIATHVPLMGLTGTMNATLLQTKIYPYSTYVVGARVPRNSLPVGLYNDTSDPYFYLRVHDDGDARYAVFGGADHKTGEVQDTATCYAEITRALRDIIPEAAVERRWSGQVIETSDGLPFIGQTAERQFAATGYGGNGLTFGTLAGLMAHDFVLAKGNPWQELFDPNRKKLLSGLTTVIAENVDYPLNFVLDRLRRDRGATVDEVPRGGGCIVSIDGKPAAVHRSEDGDVVAVSAVCTHLGCLVRWNHAEQTWDCPCHGSRFTPEGLVLGGPAEEPLKPVQLVAK